MRAVTIVRHVWPGIAAAAIVCCAAFDGAAADKRAAKSLTLPQIKQIVEKHLQANPNYRSGDLIVRADVEPIFNELIELGFQPADGEDLYDAFVPDNSALVQISRRPAGRKFLRQIASAPGAYDRAERLSWIPEGRTLLGELIADPEGVEKFRAMCTPEGVAATQKLLASDPRGKNFDLPTGHIHTAEALLEQLSEIYARRSAERKSAE